MVSEDLLKKDGGSLRLTRLSSTSKTWNFGELSLLWPLCLAGWLDEVGNASALGLRILSGGRGPTFAL